MSERRYRQAGYQEAGRAESRPARTGPLPDGPGGPRGRGLGAPGESTFRCAVCGRVLPAPEPENGAARCPHCRADLHTCTHCRYFDPAARNQCRAEPKEPVAAKARANDCPQFLPRTTREHVSEAPTSKDARSAFDALFDL